MDTAKTPRWMAATLIVSLALNCLLIGGGVAVSLRWRLHPEEQTARMALRQIDRKLDRADARLMRATVLQHRPQIAGAWVAYHDALKPVAAALQATPLDPERLHAAEQEARDKRVLLGDAVFDAVLEGIGKISPQGRATLLQDRAATP